jgi:nucleoside-diphosphate-sugar epimerase
VQEPPFQQLKNENKIQLEYVKADITDPIAMKQATKGINSIFHFAAVISFNYFDSEERVQKINFGGTKNLIEAGIENGVDRFL